MSKRPDDEVRQLLANLFDCLDRTFDGETEAYDLHALVYATLAALSDTHHAASLRAVEIDLQKIVRSGRSLDQQRDDALAATDVLRTYLANMDELT